MTVAVILMSCHYHYQLCDHDHFKQLRLQDSQEIFTKPEVGIDDRLPASTKDSQGSLEHSPTLLFRINLIHCAIVIDFKSVLTL